MSSLSRNVNDQQFNAMLLRTLTNMWSCDRSRCPDAEVLAAYQDRTLDDGDRDQVEAHRFQCSRCDSVIAALPSLDENWSTEHRSPWLRFSLIFPTIAIAGAIVVVLAVRDGSVVNRSSPSAIYEASASSGIEPQWVTLPEHTRAPLDPVLALAEPAASASQSPGGVPNVANPPPDLLCVPDYALQDGLAM
jgi:hypothetical protein